VALGAVVTSTHTRSLPVSGDPDVQLAAAKGTSSYMDALTGVSVASATACALVTTQTWPLTTSAALAANTNDFVRMKLSPESPVSLSPSKVFHPQVTFMAESHPWVVPYPG
jgi:hypothetical protein